MVGEAGTVSRSGGVCQDVVCTRMHVVQTDRQTVMRGVPEAGGGKGVKVETKEITLQRGGEGQSYEKLADFSSLLVGSKVKGGVRSGENEKSEGVVAQVDAQYWSQKLAKYRNLDQ